MQNYSLEDFRRYYLHSYILHPQTNQVVKVVGINNSQQLVNLSDKSSVALKDLDWAHVKTPPLGYRHLDDGKLLYYVSRRASRLTEKGVNPAAIRIDIPPLINSITAILGNTTTLHKHARLEDKLTHSIFNPEYLSLSNAVDFLINKKHSIGFALNKNWAVTLGLHKDQVLVLHFKTTRVAKSVDGMSWQFVDEESKLLFQRSKL